MSRPQLEFHEVRVPSPPVRYAVSTNSISIYRLKSSSIVYSDVFASIRIASYHSSYSDRIVKTAVRQIAFSTPEQASNLSSLYQESPNMLNHGSSLGSSLLCSVFVLFSYCQWYQKYSPDYHARLFIVYNDIRFSCFVVRFSSYSSRLSSSISQKYFDW